MAVLKLDQRSEAKKLIDHAESVFLIEGITNFLNYPFWGMNIVSLSMSKMIILSAFIIMFFGGGGILKSKEMIWDDFLTHQSEPN